MATKAVVYAVGDIGIHRDEPGKEPATALRHLSHVIREGDISFCQLERNLSDRGTPARGTAGHSRVSPRMVSALESAGFNVVSFASNHTLDWGQDAFFDTIQTLKSKKIAVVGVGSNIMEARKPVILERNGMTVAFLAYCSVAPAGYEATMDRPGLAPLRAWTLYKPVEAQPATPCQIMSFPDPDDLEAMEEDIRKVRPEADVVAVSMHWGIHIVPATIATYQRRAGHAAINAGADIIFGHHAHILKGMEVYKGKVVIYSMGNFALEDSYELIMRNAKKKAELSPDLEAYNWKPDPDYPGYGFPVDSRKTMIVKCVLVKGKIERVSFLPAHINMYGEPELLSPKDRRFREVVDYMRQITEGQRLNAKYTVEDEEVVVSE